MKLALVYVIANLCSMLCVGAAVYLASIGVSGWGWFLFIACILAVTRVKGE